MTDRAVYATTSITATRRFTKNLHDIINPLIITGKKRRLAITVVATTIAGIAFAIAQAFGVGGLASNESGYVSGGTPNASNKQAGANNNTGDTSRLSSTASNSTSITVNGQPITVPQSGSYAKSIDVPGGTVHVSGNTSQSASGGSATNSSTTNVEVKSSSGA